MRVLEIVGGMTDGDRMPIAFSRLTLALSETSEPCTL